MQKVSSAKEQLVILQNAASAELKRFEVIEKALNVLRQERSQLLMHYCRVSRSGDLLELKVCADGFLYNMVRAITGTVLYAAEGKLTPEDIPEILASGDRSLAGPTVPPGGLYMTRLWYEDERLND